MKKTFSNVKEASDFARRTALELGVTVKMEREGNLRHVIYEPKKDNSPKASQHNKPKYSEKIDHYHDPVNTYLRKVRKHKRDQWVKYNEEDRLEYLKKTKEIEKERLLAQKRQKLEAKEKAQRKPYIESRREYYQSLPDNELTELWADREKLDLEYDEKLVLLNEVRKRKGYPALSILP